MKVVFYRFDAINVNVSIDLSKPYVLTQISSNGTLITGDISYSDNDEKIPDFTMFGTIDVIEELFSNYKFNNNFENYINE